MKKNILVFILLLLPIIANLYLLRSELSIVSDVNDNVFAYALAVRMNQAWDKGSCPWNLPKCLPKLTDHWVSYWAMGYPLPHYYQHLPSIINVALFKMLNSLGFVPNTTTVLESNKFLLSDIYQNPGLFQVFNWTKYLLLCFYPLAIYWSARKFKFPKIAAAFCAVISTLISTNFQYGTDYGSLIWRGSGMHTQLWGMFFLPLAVASIYDTLTAIDFRPPAKDNSNLKLSNHQFSISQSLNTCLRRQVIVSYFKTSHLLRSILLLTFTFHAHVLYGYMASLSAIFIILALILSHLNKLKPISNREMSNIKTERNHFIKSLSGVIDLALYLLRVIRKPVIILSIIYFFSFLLLSYWIIPLFINDAYHAKSVWDELYKFDSFGAREVINRYFGGEIFDYGRFPIFTILVFAGFFFGLNKFFENHVPEIEDERKSVHPSEVPSQSDERRGAFRSANFSVPTTNQSISYLFFPLLLVFWTFLYFGRTTWGSLINFLPGSEGIHMHRFINGIHFAGIFLGGLGLYWISQKIQVLLNLIKRLFSLLGNLPDPENPNIDNQNINFNIKKQLFYPQASLLSNNFLLLAVSLLFSLLLLYPAARERLSFVNHNTYLINYYNAEYKKDFTDYIKVMTEIKKRQESNSPKGGPGRIWAGRPGNWGRQLKVGGTESYLTLSVNGFDTLGFEPESWSPNTDLEQFFNDQRLDHYNLFNIRYIIAPPEVKFPSFAKKVNSYGKYILYTVATNGHFDFITSDLNIHGDKYNTLNFARFWLESTWLEAKNHPQILYNHKYNSTVKSIQITDWTGYSWLPKTQNEAVPLSLLTQNPFNATPSSGLNQIPTETLVFIPQEAKMKNETVVNDFFSVETKTEEPSLLLLKATYHPFWQAKLTDLTSGVNNQQSAIISMHSPYFMAVNIPTGNYHVEFTYDQRLYKKLLLLISLGTLIFLLVSPILHLVKKK